MKKFICSLMVVSMLSLAAPKPEAQAGFLIVAGLEQHVWNHRHKFDDYIVYLFGGSLMVYSFFVLASGLYSPYSITSGIITLDEKLDSREGDIRAALASAHPFLDEDTGMNGPALNNLSRLIVEKASATQSVEGVKDVKLTEEEIKTATRSLDLSAEQLNALVRDLSL
jgi:hypothetical protein